MENFGEKIYNLRKEKGVSQEDLAFALNVSRQTVSRWETNAVIPSAVNLNSLRAFFNLADGYFSNGEDTAEETPRKVKNGKLINYKLFILIMASILLLVCTVACAFAGYITIAPFENEFLNNRSVRRFNCVGIVCIIIGVLSLLTLIGLWCIAIVNWKKRKM